jgi:hypothetical protein
VTTTQASAPACLTWPRWARTTRLGTRKTLSVAGVSWTTGACSRGRVVKPVTASWMALTTPSVPTVASVLASTRWGDSYVIRVLRATSSSRQPDARTSDLFLSLLKKCNILY